MYVFTNAFLYTHRVVPDTYFLDRGLALRMTISNFYTPPEIYASLSVVTAAAETVLVDMISFHHFNSILMDNIPHVTDEETGAKNICPCFWISACLYYTASLTGKGKLAYCWIFLTAKGC